MNRSVLIVEDIPQQAKKIRVFLEGAREAYPTFFKDIAKIEVEHDAGHALHQVRNLLAKDPESFPWCVIIADVFMPPAGRPSEPASPENGGLLLYDELKAARTTVQDLEDLPYYPKLVLTSNRPEDLAERAHEIMQTQQSLATSGAQWAFYLPKSRDLPGPEGHGGLMEPILWKQTIITAIRQAAESRWMASWLTGEIAKLVGTSSDIIGVKSELIRMVDADQRVICVAGESGTGKELVALALHDLKKTGQFKSMPLSTYAESEMFESIFFGYSTALLGKSQGEHEGLVGPADNGTIWLDEATIPAMKRVEPSLRRLLEYGEWSRKGEEGKKHEFKGRIVFSSSEMEDYFLNHSREDFRSRAGNKVIVLRPLREHAEDIPTLARTFFAEHIRTRRKREGFGDFDPIPALTPELLDHLKTLSWHDGNVRQLSNCMKFLADNYFGLDVGLETLASRPDLSGQARTLGRSHNTRDGLRGLLRRHAGNRARAGEEAKMSASTISKRIKEFRLESEFPAMPGRPSRARTRKKP